MNKLHLFWWNERKIMNKSAENYGDLLGYYLANKVSDKKIVFAWPKKRNLLNFYRPIYLTVGSIIHNADKNCIIWGSGFINKNMTIAPAKICSVRGPVTRNLLTKQGHRVPKSFGDPALLLPKYYNPKVEKKYKLGIIPHYTDYKDLIKIFNNNENIKVINLMSDDIEKTTYEILECEKTISSSLHGLIVSHAYHIPSLWTKFSDKPFGDDMKYDDYFLSVNLEPYKIEINLNKFNFIELESLFEEYPCLLDKDVLKEIQNDLLLSCPFIE